MQPNYHLFWFNHRIDAMVDLHKNGWKDKSLPIIAKDRYSFAVLHVVFPAKVSIIRYLFEQSCLVLSHLKSATHEAPYTALSPERKERPAPGDKPQDGDRVFIRFELGTSPQLIGRIPKAIFKLGKIRWHVRSCV